MTVTVPSTGKVYVANMPVYVSSFLSYTLTIQIEGQGTVTADRQEIAPGQYEYSDGDQIELVAAPAGNGCDT